MITWRPNESETAADGGTSRVQASGFVGCRLEPSLTLRRFFDFQSQAPSRDQTRLCSQIFAQPTRRIASRICCSLKPYVRRASTSLGPILVVWLLSLEQKFRSALSATGILV